MNRLQTRQLVMGIFYLALCLAAAAAGGAARAKLPPPVFEFEQFTPADGLGNTPSSEHPS